MALAFDRYSKGQRLSWALLIGGVSFGDQEAKLDRGVDVLIATPGRLLDHFERGKLLLNGVQIMVVDEADRMLDMGFIPDLERIFKLTPINKQTLFFSATMPPEITRLTKQFLRNPTRIEASAPATTAENIAQHIVRTPSAEPGVKRLALRTLAARPDVKNGIVFCNRKSEVDVVAKSLKRHGFNASPIHGDLDQATRMRTLEAFRQGDLKLLVASDVAARGLDIPEVSHIFNYDVPHHADDYVHRIGRTGRAGKSGEAFMLVTPADTRALEKVQKLIGLTPDEVVIDVDWTQAKVAAPRVRGERDRHSSRRTDRREWGRPATETSVASMTPLPDTLAPVTAPAAAPKVVEDPQPHRQSRNRRRRAGRPTESAEPQRRDPPDATSVQSKPSGDRVLGFGRDLPAFIKRPIQTSEPDG